MTKQKLIKDSNDSVLLKIEGAFSIQRAQELRQLCADTDVSTLVLDFEKCTIIDSSGLGLLLNLRKNLPKHVTIKLAKCPGHMQRMLSITRFERFFEID